MMQSIILVTSNVMNPPQHKQARDQHTSIKFMRECTRVCSKSNHKPGPLKLITNRIHGSKMDLWLEPLRGKIAAQSSKYLFWD